MKEESDFNVLFISFGDLFAEETGKGHEMVILDPDEIVVFDDIGDSLCERHVCFTVCIPNFFVKVGFPGMVMEQWPELDRCLGRGGYQRIELLNPL